MLNPIIPLDYPDPDVIWAEGKYYMVSTTMYFMPGCELLESEDLLHWEHCAYVYDELEDCDSHFLYHQKNIYGKGMWAASLRYHNGQFYICFVANDTHKTYLFTSAKPEGPWKKSQIEGFYHDASLLFEEDRVFIAYGNTKIYITELENDLSGPKKGGYHRCVVEETKPHTLGYEGTHFYKINGFYYLFLIHSPVKEGFYRTEACFYTDDLEKPFVGMEVFSEDMERRGDGIAQGGLVETPSGSWYAFLFQDHGAAGRFPVMVPVRWEKNLPILGNHGKMTEEWAIHTLLDNMGIAPKSKEIFLQKLLKKGEDLVASDDFTQSYETTRNKKEFGSFGLKSVWQFNHNPDKEGFYLDTRRGIYGIKNIRVNKHLLQASNTLTQRIYYPKTDTEVVLDGTYMNSGDVAGLCVLQSYYGYVALTKEGQQYYLMMAHRKKTEDGADYKQDEIVEEKVSVDKSIVRIRLQASFKEQEIVRFYYEKEGEWIPIGSFHSLYFTLDHFTGARVGLFSFGTEQVGGIAEFSQFQYHIATV